MNKSGINSSLLALFCSDKNADWKKNSDDSNKGGPYEIIANGEKSIWICELARVRKDYADFLSFKKAILSAPLKTDTSQLTVNYKSPSQGNLVMDWDSNLTQNGVPVKTKDYKRYDNPYVIADFPSDKIEFQFKGNSLLLDFEKKARQVFNADNTHQSDVAGLGNKLLQTSLRPYVSTIYRLIADILYRIITLKTNYQFHPTNCKLVVTVAPIDKEPGNLHEHY